MALTRHKKCGREWQANSGLEPCPWCRAEAAEAKVKELEEKLLASENTAGLNDEFLRHEVMAAEHRADAKVKELEEALSGQAEVYAELGAKTERYKNSHMRKKPPLLRSRRK